MGILSSLLILSFVVINLTSTKEKFLELDNKNEDNYDVSITINKESFTKKLANYFLNFASYGYCTIDEMENGLCCEELINGERWELVFKQKIELDNYNFALLKNDKFKKIIVTFPGTRKIYQFMEEVLNSTGSTFKELSYEKIMNYFNTIYKLIQQPINQIVHNLYQQFPGYQYIFTGHSLGAAMATILCLDLVKYGSMKSTENSPVLITYGQPRTGNDIFSNEVMTHIPIVFRVVRQYDLIATFPRCSINMYSFYCYNVLPDSKFIKSLNLTEKQKSEEEENYYSWHIGGLKLFTNEMDSYTDCLNIYGDNNPKEDCEIKFSFNIHYHTVYFGKHVSKLCRKI